MFAARLGCHLGLARAANATTSQFGTPVQAGAQIGGPRGRWGGLEVRGLWRPVAGFGRLVMPLISYRLEPIAAAGLKNSEGTTKCLSSNKSSAKWSLTTGGSFLRKRFHMGPSFPAAVWQTSASLDMTKGKQASKGARPNPS